MLLRIRFHVGFCTPKLATAVVRHLGISLGIEAKDTDVRLVWT